MATSETATLGGGCFWCLEAVYDEMEGVLSVESGYMGGHVPNPDYHTVCTGRSGPRGSGAGDLRSRQSRPSATSWRSFSPSTIPPRMDRQGNDSGPQYRSVIFYHDDAQRAVAEQIIAELDAEELGSRPIVTELRPADHLLCRRGLPPGVFPQQSAAALLRLRGLAQSEEVPREIRRKVAPVTENVKWLRQRSAIIRGPAAFVQDCIAKCGNCA